MLLNSYVDVELRNTSENGRCVICEEKLENDCQIYCTLSGFAERPEYYSIKDVYGDKPINRVEGEDEDEDQRMAKFSNYDVTTYCEYCFNQIVFLIDSVSSEIKERKKMLK